MPTPTSRSQSNQQTVGQMCWQDAKAWMLLGAFAGAAYLYSTKAPTAAEAATLQPCAQTTPASATAASANNPACIPSPANE